MLKRCCKATALAVAIASAGNAQAQHNAMTGMPAGDIGVKLSETSVLHVGVAAEAGYDTNVFYNDDVNEKRDSAMFRVIPSFLITNNGRDGKPRSNAIYTLGANLVYREYFNDDPNVRSQRAFVPSAVATLSVGGEKAKLALGDIFSRTEDPPYFQTGNAIVRDNNQANATLGLSPGGGRLTGTLRYGNTFDYFETTEYKYASSMTHDGMIDGSWKWLPKTALFLQVGGAYVDFLNPELAPSPMLRRTDSLQFRVAAGLRGLVTPKTTVNLTAGYSTAFYSDSASNPSGLSNLLGVLDIGYMPALLTRLSLLLQHTFRNSPVIGDYYDVDSATLTLSHALGRMVFQANTAFEYRRYHNYVDAMGAPVPRKDSILTGGASLDFYIQKWFYAGVSYGVGLSRPTGDNTGGAVTYTKQQVLGRLGIAY